MKNKIAKYFALAGILFLGFASTLFAQSFYKISDSKENAMKLSGTSTFHDWDMNTGVFTGNAQFGFKEGKDNLMTTLKSLTFALEVLNLKSGETALDENAYKALKTDQYKSIVYKLTSAKVFSIKDNKYLVKTVGNLIIAGVTRKVSMDVYCVDNKDGTITCTGLYNLKMTDYQVKPPSFMLGAMKTGDAISLNFTMVYKKQIGI